MIRLSPSPVLLTIVFFYIYNMEVERREERGGRSRQKNFIPPSFDFN